MASSGIEKWMQRKLTDLLHKEINKSVDKSIESSMGGFPLEFIRSGGLFGYSKKMLGAHISGGAKVIGSLGQESPFAAGAQALGGVGEAVGSVPVLGRPLKFLTKLGETALTAVDRLRTWSESLHEGNMKFAEFSGTMATINAEMQIQRTLLSMERGERRSGIARKQMEARINAERNFEAPLQDMWDRIKGEISSKIDTVLAGIGKALNLPDLAQQFAGQPPQSEAQMTSWLQQLSDPRSTEEMFRMYGRPPQFRNP